MTQTPTPLIASLSDERAIDIGLLAYRELFNNAKAACIEIVDASGRTLFHLEMTGARKSAAAIAHLKAVQAAHTGHRTSETAKEVESGKITPELIGLNPRTFVPFGGGVPVWSKGGILLGGVGVSNLSAEEDEDVAILGVHALGFETKKPK